MPRVLTILLAGGLALLDGAAQGATGDDIPVSPDAVTIKSISVTGANLVVETAFPAGRTNVTLESQSTMSAPWVTVAQTALQTNQTGAVFAFSKPATAMAFFRLRLDGGNEPEEELSSALQVVSTESLGEHLAPNGDAVFRFSGKVDGSDFIKINHFGAFWNHVNWGWPDGAVTINGTQWNPQQKNYLTTVGLKPFLPEIYAMDTAELEITRGRDVVAMERTKDAVIIYLDDTPPGADIYEFNVHFHPAPLGATAKASSTAATLEVAGQIDGSDRIKVTASQAVWMHQAWSPPANVTLNGIPWDPMAEPTRKNEGTNRFLPAGVDFSTARIASRQGRDLATMWSDKDAVWIQFADNPNGADYYDIKITFGN